MSKGGFHIAKKPMLEILGAGQSTPDCPADSTGLFGASDCPVVPTGLSDEIRESLILPIDDSAEVQADVGDWRMSIIAYLRDPSVRTDRKIR